MTSSQDTKSYQIGQLLLDAGAVTQEQVDAALEHQRAKGNRMLLGEVLVQMGFCDEEQIMGCLAQAYEMPFVRVSPKVADPNVTDLLPRQFCEKHMVLPLFKVRNALTLAVHEPSNVFLVEEVARLTGCRVHVVCATAHDIGKTLETYMPDANVFVIDDIIEGTDGSDFDVVEEVNDDITDLEVAAGDSPVIKLVNYLISSAAREGASDIHIEPDDGSLRIRYRVDGQLYEKLRPPAKLLPGLVSRIKIMARMDISERRLPQDGGIHVLMEGRPVDLRVSSMPGNHGEKVVIRIIDSRDAMMDLERLGFSYDVLTGFRKALERPHGIVLVTGPTGSGKSTTLYAALTEIASDELNLCTVEDPIEYNLTGVNQFQVSAKIGFTFSGALRSLLRQDPDVIMIGEVRDAETARIAVQAALTGHVVLSTLHTNNAPDAVARLLDIGVEPYLVAASLEACLAQRLVRKICTHCKEPYDPPENIRRAVEVCVGKFDAIYRGRGCNKCRNTGFSGRIGIHELLVPSESLRKKITASPDITAIRKLAIQGGLIPLRDDGMAKVKAGITTVEEVFRATAA